MERVLYTAEAVVQGGRAGHGRTSDGRHGGFTLAVSLDLHAPHLSNDQAAELMLRAHERCPYSNATRGNIEVELKVDGAPVNAASASGMR